MVDVTGNKSPMSQLQLRESDNRGKETPISWASTYVESNISTPAATPCKTSSVEKQVNPLRHKKNTIFNSNTQFSQWESKWVEFGKYWSCFFILSYNKHTFRFQTQYQSLCWHASICKYFSVSAQQWMSDRSIHDIRLAW